MSNIKQAAFAARLRSTKIGGFERVLRRNLVNSQILVVVHNVMLQVVGRNKYFIGGSV